MLDLKLFGALALMLGTESMGPTSQPPTRAEAPVVVAGDPTASCELAALMPHAPVTADECKALINLFQVVAVVNPDASRDGDEQMNCSDIRSELSHMPRLGQGLRLDGSQAVRFDHSIAAVAQDLSESIRANPRLGRLVQLGAARHCKAPRRKAAPTRS
jgi:hypothetical protein